MCFGRLTLAEYHEQEEIFKLRLGHLKKVSVKKKGKKASANKPTVCENIVKILLKAEFDHNYEWNAFKL